MDLSQIGIPLLGRDGNIPPFPTPRPTAQSARHTARAAFLSLPRRRSSSVAREGKATPLLSAAFVLSPLSSRVRSSMPMSIDGFPSLGGGDEEQLRFGSGVRVRFSSRSDPTPTHHTRRHTARGAEELSRVLKRNKE